MSEIEKLRAELAAHIENEGKECPLCVKDREIEILKEQLEVNFLEWDYDR